MIYANDGLGNRIHIDQASTDEPYYCPVCGQELRQRRGEVKIHHFAHRVDAEEKCDDWENDMSEWHQSWQNAFPEECREVVVTYDGEKRRADVLVDGIVVEFQHSRMSSEEFDMRNQFYSRAGYKVVWLFDLADEYDDDRFAYGNKSNCYRWKYHWHTFDNFIPRDNKKISVYFQIERDPDAEGYGIENLIWRSPDGRYVMMQEGCSYTQHEFISMIMREKKSREYGIGDVYDTLIEQDEQYYPCFACSSMHVPYENCDTCKYSINCISTDSIGCKLYDMYKQTRFKVDAPYVSGCLFRFQDILDGWDVENDKVLEVEYDDEFRVKRIKYIKGGKTYYKEYEMIPKSAVSLQTLLRRSKANVVGVKNIRTGKRVKIGNSAYFLNENIRSVKGYLGYSDGTGYDSFRREIFDWNKEEWIKEWER